MPDVLTRAELVKLSRVLGTAPGAVAFLAGRGHLELRELQNAISRALFDEYRPAFQRLADASRLLPASLVAKLSELVFGPMLSARIAGLMPPARAVEVATRLHTRFLADVCVEIDPRSAVDLLANIPTELVVTVAKLLLERGEFVTMGRFVDDLPDAAIRAVLKGVDDDAALVRIAGYVERRERLIELIEMLPAERLKQVVAAVAAGTPDVQAAGLAMMSQLSVRQQGRIGDIAISLGFDALQSLVDAAARARAPDVVRTVLGHISAGSRKSLERMLPGFFA